MAIGYCATVYVDADDEGKAEELAKEMVLDNLTDYYDDNLEIEQINYIGKM